MARTVLVDGYNVIRRDPTLARFERASLEQARDVLVACLNASPTFRQDEIICVFDGAGSAAAGVRAARSFRRGRVRVVFSAPGESADTVLKRFAAHLPPGVVVVTADNEVRAAVQAAGADVTNLAPRATPAHPRATRPPPRTNETWVKADDLAPQRSPSKKGNPRRAPRRGKRDEDLRW
jgi:predicted RNA-binding protein with PIN domain